MPKTILASSRPGGLHLINNRIRVVSVSYYNSSFSIIINLLLFIQRTPPPPLVILNNSPLADWISYLSSYLRESRPYWWTLTAKCLTTYPVGNFQTGKWSRSSWAICYQVPKRQTPFFPMVSLTKTGVLSLANTRRISRDPVSIKAKQTNNNIYINHLSSKVLVKIYERSSLLWRIVYKVDVGTGKERLPTQSSNQGE